MKKLLNSFTGRLLCAGAVLLIVVGLFVDGALLWVHESQNSLNPSISHLDSLQPCPVHIDRLTANLWEKVRHQK